MHKKLMRISEFAKLSGISRKLLIFYDKCGILHPREIDPENGYRYYSYRQMDTASVIRSLREAGMSLNDIKNYLSTRTPENLIATLEAQASLLRRQICKLHQIEDMIGARIRQTERGIATKPGLISVEDGEEENLFLGPPLPADYDLNDGWS